MADLFAKYKPRNISQSLWELWMVELFYDNSNYDPTIFNSWWYDRVKSEALEKLVPPEEPDARRTMGKRKRVGSIFPYGHPDFVSSISDYGGLHFGTEFGWQRKVKPAPRGRDYGWAGHLILAISMGREFLEIDRTFRAGGKAFHNWGYKDMLAAGWALLTEAEKRGDYVTIIQVPRLWERDYDKYWMQNITTRTMTKQMKVSYYKRDGTKSEFGELRRGPHGGHLSEDRKTLIINPSLERLDQGISHDYDRHLHNQMHPYWSDVGNLTPPMFEYSQDYEAIKRYWLAMPNFGEGDYRNCRGWATFPEWIWHYVHQMESKMSTTTKSNIVWLGTSQYPQMINVGWRALQDIQPKANVWFFDMGDKNKEGEYFGAEAIENNATRIRNGQETDIPLMVGPGGRLFNYIYVEDISQLTKRVLEAIQKYGLMR